MTLDTLRDNFNQRIFSNPADTTVSTAVIDSYLNRAYQEFLILALTANGQWQANGNFFTTDIVANQRDYAFDVELLKLNEVYIKSREDGLYVKAKQRDVDTMEDDPITQYIPATPEYDLSDRHIFIYLPEQIINDVAEGIRIHAQYEFTNMSGDSDVPAIPLAFQPYLSDCAAYHYAFDIEMYNKSERLKANKLEAEQKIKEFYANRFTKPVRMTPKEEYYT